MPQKITPSSQSADKVLAKQSYSVENVAQNMFAEPLSKGKKQLISPTPLKGVTIQKVWDHVFDDESDFLKRYHEKRSETNINIGSWHLGSDKSNGYRFVSLTTIIDMPRAGTKTPLNEAHRFAYSSDGGKHLFVYQISSQTPNVMSGSSFRVDAYCEILSDSADGDCTVAYWGQCKKMSSFLVVPLSVIESRALKEMTTAYKLFVDMMQKELAGSEKAEKPPPPKKCADAPEEAAATPAAEPAPARVAAIEEPCPAVVVAPACDSSNSIVQGVLLILAFFVALLVVLSTATVRQTSSDMATLRRSVKGIEMNYYYQQSSKYDHGSSRGGGIGAGKTAALHGGSREAVNLTNERGSDEATRLFGTCLKKGCDDSFTAFTEQEVLFSAARDAQINTLRYRWLEQHDAIGALQNELWWMKGIVAVLVLLVIYLNLKMWYM